MPVKIKSMRQSTAKRHGSQKESSENDTNGSEAAPENKEEKETKTMEKTMEIKGMMCGHCEARVKKTLEAIAGVDRSSGQP